MTELRNWIASQIKKAGPVPFAQFMEWALYHPELGYYTGDRRKFGKSGDFYTSPGINPVFAEVLADQLAEKAGLLRRLGDKPYTLIEFGAGEGMLARDLLNRWQAEHPALYERTVYRIVEISPTLRDRQAEQTMAHAGKVVWQTREEVKAAGPYAGAVLTNEFVDAFPVHRVVKQEDGLAELYVDWEQEQGKEVSDSLTIEQSKIVDTRWNAGQKSTDTGMISKQKSTDTGMITEQKLVDPSMLPEQMTVDGSMDTEQFGDLDVTVNAESGRFVVKPGELSDLRIAEYAAAYATGMVRGQVTEVGLAGLEWYREAAGLLDAGWIVTIDYGFDAEMLHHKSRMDGTLRGFYRHTLVGDPFANVGEQDLTADVNFTALQEIGEKGGLTTEFYGSQSKYLLESGILHRLRDVRSADLINDPDMKRNRAIKQLIMPGGIGDHFKVLVQSRNRSVL